MQFHHPELGELTLATALSEPQILLLLEYSKTDTAIIKYTEDSKRIQDRAAFDRHARKRRYIVLARHATELLGIAWFGPKPFPLLPKHPEISATYTKSHTITSALRLYEPARGKQLALPFYQKALTEYAHSAQYLQDGGGGIWIQTDLNNTPALKTFEKLFTTVCIDRVHKKVTLVCNNP